MISHFSPIATQGAPRARETAPPDHPVGPSSRSRSTRVLLHTRTRGPPLRQVPGHHDALDLVGALIDLRDLRVAIRRWWWSGRRAPFSLPTTCIPVGIDWHGGMIRRGSLVCPSPKNLPTGVPGPDPAPSLHKHAPRPPRRGRGALSAGPLREGSAPSREPGTTMGRRPATCRY